MKVIAIILLTMLLAACAREEVPERPDETTNARLDSIEARLDAAELSDPGLATEPVSDD